MQGGLKYGKRLQQGSAYDKRDKETPVSLPSSTPLLSISGRSERLYGLQGVRILLCSNHTKEEEILLVT